MIDAQDDSQLQDPKSAGGSPLGDLARVFTRQQPAPAPGQGPPNAPQNQPARKIPRDPQTGAFLIPGNRQTSDRPGVAARPVLSPVPPGLPPQPISFTPYIPAMASRSHDQWAMPWPYPREPQGWEVPGIYRGVGSSLGKWGSGNVMLLSLLLGKHAGDFMTGYMKGEEFRTKMQREQMTNAAMELEFQQQQELHDYHDVIDEYAARGYDNTGALEQELEAVALRYNDTNMLNLLASGAGPGKAADFLRWRDAKWQDLHAANKKASKEEDKQAETDRERKDWGLPPAPSSGGEQPRQPGEEPMPPGSRFAPPPPAAPAQPTAAAAPPGAAPAPASGDEPPWKMGAEDIVRGEDPSKIPASVRPDAQLEAAKMRRRLINIAANPDIKPEDVVPEVRKVSPGIASDLQGYMDYRKGPGASGAAGGGGSQTEFWDTMGDLAAKAKPGWTTGNFEAIKEFKNPNSRNQLKITRAATLAQSGKQVLDDLKLIDDPPSVFANVASSAEGMAGGDARYQKLYADWLTYNQDANVLKTGGTGSVTETEMATRIVPKFYTNKAAYRAIVASDMGVAKSAIEESRIQWKQLGSPDRMFGENPAADQIIDQIGRMDWKSGLLPGESKPDRKGVLWTYTGKNPANPDADENWVRGNASP